MSISPWTKKAPSVWTRLLVLPVLVIFFLAPGGIPAFAQSSQSTDFAIGDTVLHAPVKRLGIDLGGQTYWDSSQIMRNLIFRNPGFEGETWQTAIHCAAGTATTCLDYNSWNVWPADFLKGASLEVISGAANGLTTTITGNTVSDFGAGNSTNPSKGMTISFNALSKPLGAGDWIIVRNTIPGNAQAGWWTSTSGGATLTTNLTDIAPDSPGKQALQMNADQSGQSASVNQAFDTLNGHSFIQLKGTYTLEFKAKGLSGNNQLNVNVVRLATVHGNENFLNQNVTLTNQWKDYSYTFTANEDGSYIGPVQVLFSISGASIELDDVALNEQPAPDNPTAFRNAVVTTLRELQPGVIRYMTGTDFGSSIADLVAVPFARQRAGINSQASVQEDIPMGLEEFLVLCQAVGAEPWYTFAGEATPKEMQDLMDFLGGSTSTPYGAIRAALGQATPWTAVFPKIHIELGNEMWNGAMPGEAITDPVVYGQRAKQLFTAARAASGYDPSKIDLVLSSWAAVPWYTQQEMLNSGGFDSVDAAPYLFNSLSDYSSNEAIFGPMFAQPEQVDSRSNGYMAQQAATAAAGSPPAELEVYEVNLSTVAGTAPQDLVNQVVGGLGSGLAVADHMLLMLRDLGITTQNMFALTGFLNGFNNTATGGNETMPLWGAVIDMGGPTNRKRPTFLAEQLANSAILPTMLQVGVTGANPTWNQPKSANDDQTPIQLDNAHYLQSFAFTDGTHYSFIVFNLSRSGSLPITFSGNHAPTGSVLVSQLTSASPLDNNETSNVVGITHKNVDNFNSSTGYSLPPYSMTVFQWPNISLPATTTALTASPTSGDTGDTIVLTASVTPQSASNAPTGTVAFMNGLSSLGTADLDENGAATLKVTTLPAGANSITAVYGGDSNNAGSTSPAVTVNITSNAVATTTTLAASPTEANTGDTVAFTATVALASGSGIPGGNVTFYDGSKSLGTATLDAAGTASFSTTTLAAGTHSITASYGGSSSAQSSVSEGVEVTIHQVMVDTVTTLKSSASQVSPGQNVTFSATVTPKTGNGIPSGTVTFLDGTTTLGTAALNSRGTASFSTSKLTKGTHSITASYGGSDANGASDSSPVTVTVSENTVDTATALTASASQIDTGDNITFTATVTASSGTATPSGTVAFLNGSTILGTASLNANGVATYSTTALPAGTDSITASYQGTDDFNSSVSPAVTVNVKQTLTATTTVLSTSAEQIVSGNTVVLTATVSASSGRRAPTGTVTFMDGTTVLGTAQLSRGRASISNRTLAAGPHVITASYGGSDVNSSSVSDPVTVTVAPSKIKTTTTLLASSMKFTTSDSVTFTATVTPASGDTPSGTVALLDGSTVIATSNLAGGVAVFSVSSLTAGTHSITASYRANSNNENSVSAPLTVTVEQTMVATSTALTASATQLNVGQTIVLTALVAPASGSTPRGTVTFLDGNQPIGTATLNRNGAASVSTSALGAGRHSITASYGGSTSNSTSVSAPVTIQVNQLVLSTTTTLAASAAQISLNQGVTFTATVAAQSGNAVPAGTVAFLDGSTILGSAQLDSSGNASYSTSSLGFGKHTITASYSGSGVNSSSVSAPVVVSVVASRGEAPSQIGTSVGLAVDNPSPVQGTVISFTATVTAQSSGANASGTVTFLDGQSVLATVLLNGTQVVFNTSDLPVGRNHITAVYSGDNNYLGSVSSPLVVNVAAPPAPARTLSQTTTTLAASTNQLNQGDSLKLSAAVQADGGGAPAGNVTFLDGSTVLGMGTLDGNGAASFSVSSLAMGSHSITAAYGGSSDNAASTSAAVVVNVVAAAEPQYTMTLSASNVQVKRGQVANLTVTLTPLNGFNKPVQLSCSGMLPGTNCSFSPAVVTPNGGPVTSTLSILADPPSANMKAEVNTPHGGSIAQRLAFGALMPWGILALFGLRRKNRSRFATWAVRLGLVVMLAVGSFWMSGCGYSVNGSAFTMTVTSSGANIPTHTEKVTVNLVP